MSDPNREVTAVVYKSNGSHFVAATKDDDFIVSPTYCDRVGVWLKLVLGDGDEIIFGEYAEPDQWLEGENRNGEFMVQDLAESFLSGQRDQWACDTKFHGTLSFAAGIIPLGLPEGVPILVRRTTTEEERNLQGHYFSSRWIVEEILDADSVVTEKSNSDTRTTSVNDVVKKAETPNVIPSNVPKEKTHSRIGVVTGVTGHQDRRTFSKKIYIWTPELRIGIEFQLNLRYDQEDLSLGDWIEFPISQHIFYNNRNSGHLIHSFTKVSAGYQTRVVRNTVEILIPHITVPQNIRITKVVEHPEFGPIFDRDRMLDPGVVMDFVVVRGRPKQEEPYCWRVVRAKPTSVDVSFGKMSLTDHSRSQSPIVSPAHQLNSAFTSRQNTKLPSTQMDARLSDRRSTNSDQSANGTQPRIPVNTVSLNPTNAQQQSQEIREEIAVVVDDTSQLNVYTVWFIQSHMEGSLYLERDLLLGASFRAKLAINNGKVTAVEYIEEVENVFVGGITDKNKIELYVDVVFKQSHPQTTFWNDFLGDIRDPSSIITQAQHPQNVVVRRLRFFDHQGFLWCIVRRNGPTGPVQDVALARDLELLTAFADFFKNDELREIILRDDPIAYAALAKFYEGDR